MHLVAGFSPKLRARKPIWNLKSNISDRTAAEAIRSQFSRWSSIALMVAILSVAGILSALTAMRFAIRGREVMVPSLVGKTEAEAQRF